jgi:SpoVK/Ycf46/Vps4 family AAA+-type ATPase
MRHNKRGSKVLKDTHDLNLIIRSDIPIIRLETHEETRALQLLTQVGIKCGVPVYSWSVTEGIQRFGFGSEPSSDCCEPEEVLRHIKASRQPALFVLCDFHPYLAGAPKIVRLLKEIALQYQTAKQTVVLLSHQLEIPAELSRYSAYFQLSLPGDGEIRSILMEEAKAWASNNKGVKVKTDNATLSKLIHNLQGMTYEDTRRLIKGAICDDGAITDEDLPEVGKAKFALMDLDGILSFEYDTAKFADVGGLENLRQWLDHRRPAFVASDTVPGLIDQPKGVLLLGVQGGGKSLAAKAVAGLWGVPLLRLDFAQLYNKYIGESERNLRQALALADVMGPCVLWMDELEKGLSSSDEDGVGRRLLGTLLTWMAERQSPVFMVATSNNIAELPAELVRKGRFDEIFFVDLPTQEVRKTIFDIHLRRRQQDVEAINCDALAIATEGFTGAEIEQLIVAALYSAAAQQQCLTTALLEHEIAKTNPLSVTMSEQVAALRRWAAQRAVLA